MLGTNAGKCAATVGGMPATELEEWVAATIQLSKSNSGSLATAAPSGTAVTPIRAGPFAKFAQGKPVRKT